MRDYINMPVHIDGRTIPYPVYTAAGYFKYHDHVEDLDNMFDNHYEICEYIGQILGLKQSCFLLRNTTHSCQSVSDGLYRLKQRLIKELADKYGYTFDEEWVENIWLGTISAKKKRLREGLYEKGITLIYHECNSPIVFFVTEDMNSQEVAEMVTAEGFILAKAPSSGVFATQHKEWKGYWCELKSDEGGADSGNY